MRGILNIVLTILTFLKYLIPDVNAQAKPDIEKLDDAVVLVMIYDQKGDFVGHGSGFIISSKGTVVTNYHVVKGAYSLKVRVDKNGVKTDYEVDNILNGEQSKDLVKISLKNPYGIVFPYLTLAKNYPPKGDDCWAIGTPADPKYMNTVSKGVVSNINLNSIPKILQTNAEITHGSSGGALINSKGEVIGVTSAGDGSDDGARASINFAIWIGELNDLPSINKKSIIDPASIPCQLGFYTNSPHVGDLYLYIDGIFVGSLSKFFKNNYTPICGEDGTITRYLSSGTHTYQAFFANTGQWGYGNITLNPGQCQMFRVGDIAPTNEQEESNYIHTNYKRCAEYKWMLGLGYWTPNKVFDNLGDVVLGAGTWTLNRYFSNGNFATQIFWSEKEVSPYTITSYGVDFKMILRYETTWLHPYFGPSLKFINTFNSFNSNSLNQIFYNARLGVECVQDSRVGANFEIGIGYLTKSGLMADANFVIGYRFGRRKK